MNTSQARHLIVNSRKVLIGAEGNGYELERGADIEVSHVDLYKLDAVPDLLCLIREILAAHVTDMELEGSNPTISIPALAVGMSTRPVPQPNSRSRPPALASLVYKEVYILPLTVLNNVIVELSDFCAVVCMIGHMFSWSEVGHS